MRTAGATAAAAKAMNPKTGPLAYESEKSWRMTLPHTPGCAFGSTRRLGILTSDEVENQVQKHHQAAAHTAGAKPRRPLSARLVHTAGRGHWIDGMATGATIVGHYNRFSTQVPGVAAYDIARSMTFRLPHAQRCVMGTAARFPGDKPVGPRDGSVSPRAAKAPPVAPASARRAADESKPPTAPRTAA
jgi:hypothetical protein